jgi:hypothetical protein
MTQGRLTQKLGSAEEQVGWGWNFPTEADLDLTNTGAFASAGGL